MKTEEIDTLISLCRIEIKRWGFVQNKQYMVILFNLAMDSLKEMKENIDSQIFY